MYGENNQLNLLKEFESAGERKIKAKPEDKKNAAEEQKEKAAPFPIDKEKEYWQKVFPELKKEEEYKQSAKEWGKKIIEDIDNHPKETPSAAEIDAIDNRKPEDEGVKIAADSKDSNGDFSPAAEYYTRWNNFREDRKGRKK